MSITDPLGRQVFLPEELCIKDIVELLVENLVYDDFEKVIETPACIIEVADNHIYYFRSLGWNYTVLIEVEKQSDTWVAITCLKNPSSLFISSLLKHGKFIPGATLG